MIWSLILYVLLLLFATRMILKLAPPVRVRRRFVVQPSNQLRLELASTRLPFLEQTVVDRHCDDAAVEEKELVGV